MRHLIASLSLCVVAAAQGTVRDVPGTFATIPLALAASAPGDVVEIAGGVYPAFDCSIGVTLRAAVPGTATFDLTPVAPLTAGVPMHFVVPAGQTLHVVGVDFRFPAATLSPQLEPRIDVVGRAVFEQCQLAGAGTAGSGRVRIAPDSLLHLQNVAATGPLLDVEGAVTATQSTWQGPNVLGFTIPAVRLAAGATLRASGCTLSGGSSSIQIPAPALVTATGASAWLVECTVAVGSGLGGNCAVAGSGVVELSRCVVLDSCSPPQVPNGIAASRQGPVTSGAVFRADFRTAPLLPVGVHASFELVSVPLPISVQPVGAPPAASFQVAFGLADAFGAFSLPLPVPPNPLLIGQPVWLHGWSGTALPLQVAAPVGGLVR